MKGLEQVIRVITYAGIVQGFFVAFLLNSKGVTKSRANLFLSILLISLSFSVAHIVYAGSILNHLSVRVYSIGDPTFLLISPLLWFYTKELTGEKVTLSWKAVLHFLPFLLIILASLSFQNINNEGIVRILVKGHGLGMIFFWVMVVAQFSCYQFFINWKWTNYQRIIQQEVSNTENVNISWVKFFMAIFLLINVLFFFSLFAVIHLQNRSWLLDAIAVIFSLSVFALGYKGILQKDIFSTSLQMVQPEGQSVEVKQNKSIKPDQELIDRLLRCMEESKPFLDPELTLSELAKTLNINRSFLSQIINDGLGYNFYNFINKYRVEEVKRLMVDPSVKNLNMLGLALEAGFKSKSTFNLIFKRFTGLTPTEYRKNLSE